MDTYRENPSEFDLSAPAEADDTEVITTEIGTDERRMHVRAYNYWVSLLNGRDFPSIEDLEPGDVTDFQANSILLDFTCGHENPAVPFIGAGSVKNAILKTIRAPSLKCRAVRCCRASPTIICRSSPTERRSASRRSSRTSARIDLLSRNPDALLLGRGDDRLHLRRDQLEIDGC